MRTEPDTQIEEARAGEARVIESLEEIAEGALMALCEALTRAHGALYENTEVAQRVLAMVRDIGEFGGKGEAWIDEADQRRIMAIVRRALASAGGAR